MELCKTITTEKQYWNNIITNILSPWTHFIANVMDFCIDVNFTLSCDSGFFGFLPIIC